MNIKTVSRRGANAVAAHPQRMQSADGSRWATGRYVKGEAGPGRWEAVEVWTLKTRDADGKVITTRRHADRATAEAWVAAANESTRGTTMSTTENSPAGVLATLRRHAESHRALAGSDAYSEQEAPRLEAALAAVEELVKRGRALQRRAGRAEWAQFAKALTEVEGGAA